MSVIQIKGDAVILIRFPKDKVLLCLRNPPLPQLDSFVARYGSNRILWVTYGWRERLAFWLLGLKPKGK